MILESSSLLPIWEEVDGFYVPVILVGGHKAKERRVSSNDLNVANSNQEGSGGTGRQKAGAVGLILLGLTSQGITDESGQTGTQGCGNGLAICHIKY